MHRQSWKASREWLKSAARSIQEVLNFRRTKLSRTNCRGSFSRKRRLIEEMMISKAIFNNVYSGWADDPLHLVPQVKNMRIHPDHPYRSWWDCSTVNNHFPSWILFTRLNPDAQMERFAELKKNGFPLFYDPVARMIHFGTQQPAHISNNWSMSWQNFFF